MIRIKMVWFMPIWMTGIMLTGCSPKTRYDNRLERELASGERYDTLFMGMHFGMAEKDFYMHCWELNQQGLIRQGSNNTTVEYHTKGELKHPGTMNFYPAFMDGKIVEMPVEFAYNGWAPWNNKLSSEVLQQDVLRWYRKIYGPGFIKVKHPERGLAFVKVDGNRRITVFKKDEIHVWAVFTDLLVEQPLTDSTSRTGDILNNITKDVN